MTAISPRSVPLFPRTGRVRRIFLVAASSGEGLHRTQNGRSAFAAGIALHALRNSIEGRFESAKHGILWVGFHF